MASRVYNFAREFCGYLVFGMDYPQIRDINPEIERRIKNAEVAMKRSLKSLDKCIENLRKDNKQSR